MKYPWKALEGWLKVFEGCRKSLRGLKSVIEVRALSALVSYQSEFSQALFEILRLKRPLLSSSYSHGFLDEGIAKSKKIQEF